jgi:hypothetical protein
MRSRSGAPWRGPAAALLTVALAVGAHGIADGAVPSGAAAALLVVLAVTLGGLAASSRRTHGLVTLTALLGTGQVIGHLLMAAVSHQHATPGPPTPAMVGAHAAAVLVGAALIVSADRLSRALSAALREFRMPPSAPPRSVPATAAASDQPWQWTLLLAASLSRRGPPVGLLR